MIPGLVSGVGVQSASIHINLKGAVAQLGERLICTQEVAGSIPTSSTILEPLCAKHRAQRGPACTSVFREWAVLSAAEFRCSEMPVAGPVAQLARAHP